MQSLPEEQFRQRIVVEMTAGNSDIDAFMTLIGNEGTKFLKAGWYEPVKPYLDNPALTAPDFNPADIGQGAWESQTVVRHPDRDADRGRWPLPDGEQDAAPAGWRGAATHARRDGSRGQETHRQVEGDLRRVAARPARPGGRDLLELPAQHGRRVAGQTRTRRSTRPRRSPRSNSTVACCASTGRPGPPTTPSPRSTRS